MSDGNGGCVPTVHHHMNGFGCIDPKPALPGELEGLLNEATAMLAEAKRLIGKTVVYVRQTVTSTDNRGVNVVEFVTGEGQKKEVKVRNGAQGDPGKDADIAGCNAAIANAMEAAKKAKEAVTLAKAEIGRLGSTIVDADATMSQIRAAIEAADRAMADFKKKVADIEKAEELRAVAETGRNSAYATAEKRRDDAAAEKEAARDAAFTASETLRSETFESKEAERDAAVQEATKVSERVGDLALKVNGSGGKLIKAIPTRLFIKTNSDANYRVSSTGIGSLYFKVNAGDTIFVKANSNNKAYIYFVLDDVPNLVGGEAHTPAQLFPFIGATVEYEKTIEEDCWAMIACNPYNQTAILDGSAIPAVVTINGNDILNGYTEPHKGGVIEDIASLNKRVDELEKPSTSANVFDTLQNKTQEQINYKLVEDTSKLNEDINGVYNIVKATPTNLYIKQAKAYFRDGGEGAGFFFKLKSGDVVDAWGKQEGVEGTIQWYLYVVKDEKSNWSPNFTPTYIETLRTGDAEKHLTFEATEDCYLLGTYLASVTYKSAKNILVNGKDIVNGYKEYIKKGIVDSVEEIKSSIDSAEERIDRLENKEQTDLPDYYTEYLKEKIDKIFNTTIRCSGECDTFLFFSDTHWEKNFKMSPLLIQKIVKDGLTSKVIYGGDACNNDLNDEQTDAEIRFQMKFPSFVKPYARYYAARGNHDYNGVTGSYTPLTIGAERNIFFSHMGNDVIINTDDAESHPYYYFDDYRSRIRYIVFSVIPNMPGMEAMSFIQFDWMAHNAILGTPNGFDIIFVNHNGCLDATSPIYPVHPETGEYTTALKVQKAFASIVSASATKTEFAYNRKTYDFSSLSARVIAFMSGHTHFDSQAMMDGVAHIGICADTNLGGNAVEGGNATPKRKEGTITENLLDFVVADKGTDKISCIRIGAGYDRVFNRAKVSVQVGQTSTLQSSINAVEWGIYDSDTEYSNIKSDYASISNGIVRGLAKGQATAWAKDANGNREFFWIVVE